MARVAAVIIAMLRACTPAQHTCPAQQPPIDSSCEAYTLGLSCLYAHESVGCTCDATRPSQREDDHPWTQIWGCGEHGEME